MLYYGLIGLAILGCVLQACFIAVEHKEKYVPAVILKGSASMIFCIIGFVGLLISNIMPLDVYGNPVNYSADFKLKLKMIELIFEGLLFGALGDILLNLRFVFQKAGQKIFLAGIASFLVGHILYMVSLILVSNSVLICSICGVVVAVILLAIIFKTFDVKIAFKIFGVLYIGAVCLMASYSIGNAITSDFKTSALIYAIGAIAFLISDVVLIFNTFGKTTKFSLRITNLSLYYIGQLLIAFSIFFI